MTVSIIIPYLEDGTNYLQDCLDSIAAQAFKDVQILLEKDDPANPLGVAAMRNRALNRVEGDYVLFLDSDDYLGREALTSAVFTASMNPGAIVKIPVKTTLYKYSTSIEQEDRERELAGSEEGSSNATELEADVKKEDTERPMSMDPGCIGLMVPTELIGELRFEENYRYYSDLPFTAQLFERAECIEAEGAWYYSRRHNDSVNHPSLSQEVNPDRFPEFCNGVRLASGYVSDITGISCYLCEFLLLRTAVGKNPKAEGWSDRDIREFSAVIADIGINAFKYYRGEKLKMLKAFKSGNIKRIRRLVKLHHRREKLNDLKKSAHQRRLLVYNKLFLKLPVKQDVVLFSSFFGRSYCDSCRALYEYMLKEYPERKYVWAINNDETDIPGNCKRVKTNSLKYYYYLAVSGAYINNVRQPEWYIKRPGTIMLETWHGTPLKKLVFDLEDVYAAKTSEYKKRFYKQACQWDYLISDNAFSTEAFSTAFMYPKEKMLEMGYPRNDLLYGDDREERALAIKEKLGLPKDKKLVLYAPTWRDDEAEGAGVYGFSLKLDLAGLEKLSDRYHFILRTHYLISDNLKLDETTAGYVTDLSKYNDIGELYLISDVLITDYSSVFFDYANLRRPILFFVYDFEKYRDVLHGFYFNMEEGCPGPMLKTNKEVIEALENIEETEKAYKEKYEEFCNKFCYLDDGHASERIIRKVFG